MPELDRRVGSVAIHPDGSRLAVARHADIWNFFPAPLPDYKPGAPAPMVIYLKRVFIANKPRRFVTEIAEIQPSQFMEGDKVVVQNIFEDKGNGLAWTGYFPERLAKRMEENAVLLRPNFFRS